MSKPTPSTDPRRPAPAADIDELVTAVLGASRVLVGVSARSLAGVEEAVTLTQFRTLVVLSNVGKINLNRLADLLDVTPSTAMRMIDRLLSAGLVTRNDNPSNRREVILGLTDSGRQLVRQVTTKRRREIARIVAAMPAIQRKDLVVALRAFADAAGEPPPHDSGPAVLGW